MREILYQNSLTSERKGDFYPSPATSVDNWHSDCLQLNLLLCNVYMGSREYYNYAKSIAQNKVVNEVYIREEQYYAV